MKVQISEFGWRLEFTKHYNTGAHSVLIADCNYFYGKRQVVVNFTFLHHRSVALHGSFLGFGASTMKLSHDEAQQYQDGRRQFRRVIKKALQVLNHEYPINCLEGTL